MTRKKVKLAYITNDAARKATFKKRKKGLLKKVGELSTLCGVDACAVICSPYEAAPEVYPSPLGAQRVLARFRRMPEMDQNKKMVNQEGFLRQRITKATEQLKRLRKENREKELTRLMLQGLATAGTRGGGGGIARVLHGLNVTDLNDLGWLVEQNLKDVGKKLDKVRVGKMKREVEDDDDTEYAPYAPPPPPPPQPQPQPRERALVLTPPPEPVAWHTGETSGAGWHAAPPIARGIRSARVRRQSPPTLTAPPAPEMAAMQQLPHGAALASGSGSAPKQQWLVDMMMSSNQDHHDHMINLGFGDQTQGNWGNGFYP